ncbi:3-oxoacyl-(acyl-carrier protein) reductase [Corynebacterium mustelae]|uniref:3-oxoacyl-(Acyl-carrier protein) reductase n=1 Tax=Corynebacterium mustelae TaxID=571915 RepID=A0A0G3H208_9CORY|nr:type I polyketide synthase [Corynebacterium mustelae]AKK06780.1 3-oxoacyl-(acyl-carrier protein) reductase [Corynebacterium mustelae]
MTDTSHKFGLQPGTDRLIDRFATQPFALAFSGQGFEWLPTLQAAVAQGARKTVAPLVEQAAALIAPVADEIAGTRPYGFDPLNWADHGNIAIDLSQAAVSVPGIFVAQLAVLDQLEAQGLDVESAIASIGHSQGLLGVIACQDLSRAAEVLAIAQLVGAAITRQARITGLVATGEDMPMVAISGVSRQQVEEAIAVACGVEASQSRPVIGLRNSRDTFVIVGRPADNRKVVDVVNAWARKDAKAIEEKQRGGAAFAPTVTPLAVQVGFHHPLMADGVEQVVAWAKKAELDVNLAREVAQSTMVDPVDWLAQVTEVVDAGARWILDVGPAAGVGLLTNSILVGRGALSLSVSGLSGQSQLFDAGQAPELPRNFKEFAPRLLKTANGNRVSTKFTELTGRSPMLLAGMTPTTVDPEIVAAAANAGHWAELAGGGQVTPEILEAHIEKLTSLLLPGVNAQFNSMFLDPYLWKMQIGGKRLVPKARANGAPIDGIVVTAGIPEHDEAVALVHELRDGGFPWVAFKPGAVRQIAKVLAVAADVPDVPVIVQVEGGKAGGHHSWEDLDDLLINTYEDIRAHDNVVLCVGGGIGTPERAAEYLTGDWATKYDLPPMPVDGILIGTAAMATKEAKTSESVKKMLVETTGIEDWVGAGKAAGGMASGRSQLGADIHEIDNSFARAGRLLDEVAGDADAVAARRDEIIAAIAKTAKPYFGHLPAMTYTDWLERYLELSGPYKGEWTDISWFNRFAEMVARCEARLIAQDHGRFAPQVQVSVEDDPAAVVEKLVAAYPEAATDTLHPADVAWFMQLCRTPGKPVNFVPVIDQDVRRWWRSDSLWQSHDERYDADQVAIIPGIAAVAGITKANEPVAELLERFNAATIAQLENDNAEVIEEPLCPAKRVINASGTYWAGRHQTSLIARLSDIDAWEFGEVNGRKQASHGPTGAILIPEDDEHVVLTVPLAGSTAFGTTADLDIRISIPKDAPISAVPQVTQADAEAAMTSLATIAAGGQIGENASGVATWRTTLSAEDIADYVNVTAGHLPSSIVPAGTAPDVLVGRSWPAIFAAVQSAVIPGTDSASVVEGMLSLVHLEHHITLIGDLPNPKPGEVIDIEVTAQAEDVSDTEIGRIILIRAEITAHGNRIAKLSERMAVRGRRGKATARTNTSVLPTHEHAPRSFRAYAKVTAPESMHPFAVVSGDRNPIHVSDTAAALAGLNNGVIVHGMWTSAIAELLAAAGYSDESVTTAPAKVAEYTATMLAPILPGAEIEFLVERTGIDTRPGRSEVREVTATVNGQMVLTATATMVAPETFYAFPGQGIQSQGMGMESRSKSAAAREVWDRADKHTRSKLGFSVLEIVQNNPTEVVVAGETFTHPKGVLFLTQFTQVAMACLGVAQIAEMREANVLNQRAFFAGHSVGEYNALAAYADVLSLENVVEIVYQRGLTMHRLVERDAEGNSNYGLAALRPHKMGLTAENVFDFVADIANKSGEFLEIVNYNLAGMQYAVAGTFKGLKALEAACDEAAPGQRAFILIPGIDVPFHSSHLLGGVDAFRDTLDDLLPDEVELDILVGRYIPNLVARPFELTREFVESILEVVDAPIIKDILADFDVEVRNPKRLARTLLVELLAWQFASPVRWIETQDLLLRSAENGGLGAERFVEVGVGSAPTLANMMAQTTALPQYAGVEVEILNVERDRSVVFASDEIVREVPEPEQPESAELSNQAPAQPASTAETTPVADTAVPVEAPAAAPAAAGTPSDISFGPAEATAMLIALWTKVRPDQMGASDSIETLVEGVSSRRNQLLLDLGVEFGLGAIDGAADAELNDLYATVSRMAKGYTAFGPVLSEAVGDALRRLTGPTGKRANYISERVTGAWGLGQGWADHVVAEVVLCAREGASLRGGDLATLSPAAPGNAAELDQLIDAAVQAVAAKQGVAVAMPGAGGGAGGGVVDSAALGEFAEQVTGKAGVLAAAARTILSNLGLDAEPSKTLSLDDADADAALFELVSRELGSDWPRQIKPRFDENLAVLIDDRWASAREDITRVALGEITSKSIDVTGAGEQVARQAEFFGLSELAAQARDNRTLEFAEDVAVVTGASPNSIAASVVKRLLAGGATVIATTSSLSHDRLGYYKKLYSESARGTAALWVVPANLSSFSDLDDLIAWVGSAQTATVNGASKLVKPALKPTLLFPFAAPRVSGSLADAGPAAEMQMRLLLWSVERLIAGLSTIGTDTHVGRRLHVVLPGSPNRGRFGGDGAYGESKAALDALVTRWNAEPAWQPHTSLVHMLIGWVRGTGLMGGNDPLVEAVEAAGVTTYSTEEMADLLVAQIATDVRATAAQSPVTVDVTGGLGEIDIDLPALARQLERGSAAPEAEEPNTIEALPTPYRPVAETTPDFANQVRQDLDDMVVIVGAGEIGPWGSSRTRFDAELTGSLTAAGVTELAWSMGLIHWDTDPTPGWYDQNDDPVAETEIFDRFHDEVLARVGVRRYHDDFGMVDNLAPELTQVYLDHDLTFNVADKAAARTFVESDPELTTATFDEDSGEWVITRKAGSVVRVPRRMAMSRFVGGQIPEGFDPTVYGIPADMIDNLDRVALWNLVATIDAFLASGFSPAELLASVHPARVSSTQGTGMGGMQSMRSLYLDGIMAEPRQNDILQEALPNVVAAHVMQSYVSGYGQMIHPVAACATAAVSVEEGFDKIKLGKSDFVVAGGFDDLSIEGITGFGDMAATADSGDMVAKGIEERFFSRANDRRRGGFIESAGGGTILLAKGSFAKETGLPVLGVIGFVESFADGAHTSIPAPGLGALGAARGGTESRLVKQLAEVGVSADDITIISKHDTSTTANDPNESDLHERIAAAIGRSSGNPLYVISQKTLTGHAKGGAAAFQIIGLTQVLRSGMVPANMSLDCVDPVLAKHEHLVWLRRPLDLSAQAPKAGLVTSLGFGHVSALLAIVHPAAFKEAIRAADGAAAAAEWADKAAEREAAGLRTIVSGMHGGKPLFERPVDRNLGATGDAAKEREAAILLSDNVRLVDGVLTVVK